MSDNEEVMLYMLVEGPKMGPQGAPTWMAYGESKEYGPAWNVQNPTFISKLTARKIISKQLKKNPDCIGFKMIPDRRKNDSIR